MVAKLASGTAATAHGTLKIVVQPSVRSSSRTRKPEYVSAATTHAALFINGAASAAGSGACSPPGCTIGWSFAGTVPASYPFAVEIDNGANILAENEATYVLHAGSNTLSTLTLNGIAANAAVSGVASGSSPRACSGSSCSGTLTIADAALDTIANTTTPPAPGFDNGPLTFGSTAAAIGTVAAGGTVTQPASTGTSSYTVTCAATSGAFFTTVTPNSTTGSGDITGAELSGLNLTYPSSITYTSHYYSCGTGTAIANAVVYVQTKRAAPSLSMGSTQAER